MTLKEGWAGLPKDNGWMFWLPLNYDESFSRPEYQELTRPTAKGLLFRLSKKPAVSEDVRERLPNFPSDLYFEPKFNEEGHKSWQSQAAKIIPKYKSFV